MQLTQNKILLLLGWLLAILFAFPLFKENISTIGLIAMGIVAILFTAVSKNFEFDKKVLFFTIPFFIVTIHSICSATSFKDFLPVKNVLFFLFFPLIFMCMPGHLFTDKKLSLYFNILRLSCAVISLAYVGMFLYFYDFKDFFIYKYNIPRFRDFVYNETPLFKIHPTYFTTILLFCTASSFEKFTKSGAKEFLGLAYIILFVCINFLLLAKLNLVLIVLLLYYSIVFRSGFSIPKKTAMLVVTVIATIALAFTIPGVKNRFTEIITSFNSPPVGLAHDSTNIRVAILECSKDIASENLMWGVGFNKIDDAFRECLKNNYNTDFFINKNYLSHNYYLYILISGGIFAAIAFFLFIFIFVRKVINTKSYLLAIMAISVLLVNFTEDYFYRHYGLFFFSLIFFTIYRNRKLNPVKVIPANLE